MEKKNFILCTETTTEVCSVSLSGSGVCIAEKSVNEPNAHGSILTVLIESILKENNLLVKDLSAIAYSSGPGSYTGLRIGLSVAKGLCYGAGIPLIEISTLQHMVASQADRSHLYFPMLDARRMEVYAALIDPDLGYIQKPFACLLEEYNWQELLEDKKVIFLGNGMAKSKSILTKFPNAFFLEDYIISAQSMCGLANDQFKKGAFVDLAYHTPFYLKEANITPANKKML